MQREQVTLKAAIIQICSGKRFKRLTTIERDLRRKYGRSTLHTSISATLRKIKNDPALGYELQKCYYDNNHNNVGYRLVKAGQGELNVS